MSTSSNIRALAGVAVLVWSLAAVPGAAASSSEVCLQSADGVWNCVKRLSLGARIAIGAGICVLISAVLGLVLCLCLRRRRARHEEAIAEVYQVEPSQIQGPLPTTYATSFDPRSPHAYPGTPEPAYPHQHGALSPANMPLPASANFPASGKSDTYPATLMRYGTTVGPGGGLRPPATAPVNQANSGNGYPFQGYSPKASPNQPYTAFTGSSGFPRPMYTGTQSARRDEWREVV